MKLARIWFLLLSTGFLITTLLSVTAQEGLQTPGAPDKKPKTANSTVCSKKARGTLQSKQCQVIPPMTVLHNPEYLSGEASVSVAANSNPLIRIGIAQNGVTLIEFPAADKFFAVHPGNSDLVTVEKSPSLKHDHHLVLRAGSGFLVSSKRSNGIAPSTSIIAQMDSGMAITLMIYPVPLLKQQAHRLVINYDRDEVISTRRTAGLATNLVGPDPESQSEITTAPLPPAPNESEVVAQPSEPPKLRRPAFKEPVEAALKDAVANPKVFKNWTEARHGLTISTTPPLELNDTVRLVVFAVRNTRTEPMHLLAGYPDLYVETLNENKRPVEAGTRVEMLYVASSGTGNLISPGQTCYFALAYVAPILGAQQHLKVVVAHMNAADEPAMADLTVAPR